MYGVVKRVVQKFQADNMIDHAAALTYYVMMSLFPALLVGVSLLGLLGDESLVSKAVDYAREQGAPDEVVNALDASLTALIRHADGTAGAALVVGLAIALYGASSAFGAAGRALNVVYGSKEERSFVRHKLNDLAWTLILIVLGIVALVCVFLGGGLASDLFGTIGIGDSAAEIWRYARWLVAIGAVLLMYGLAYAFAPDLEPRRLTWLSAGATTGMGVWILASIGFFVYVSNFSKYGATYGAFAGAVILLLWLYISSIAFLFGAELNAELEREASDGRDLAPEAPTWPPVPAPADTPIADSGDGRVEDKPGRDALAT